MGTLAPPVVAVVVAHDPGPWFEETLASLASQDYAELSVLVLDRASGEDLTARVARVLPSAFVRRFDENAGFGATVNEVRSMVEGASYFLLCHDDVALFPDTTHLLVEEAFRSNAGIVSPKEVTWSDPERLIHVGMAVDKGGAVVDRVHPNEIDHGQHDAVRDVFLAPGGCMLVRTDLFDELGGFDPAIVAMGEDLDLCWRAHVAGARIIVVPDARVRHLEELAGGRRSLEESLVAPGAEEPAENPITLQELQRRHELLAVFKCYSRFHLVRVVPQVLLLAIGEVFVAELAGNRARTRAVVRAWRWNLGRLATIRRQRAQLRRLRRLGDKEIRLLQVRGSARLSAYGRRVFQYGFHGAHADELAAAGAGIAGGVEPGDGIPGALPAGSAAHTAPGTPAAPGRVSGQVRLVSWLAAALVIVVGSRGVLSGSLPSLGQFVPFPSWSSTFTQFFTGWHPSGVGTTAPATPALALSGLAGTVLLGAMGLTQKVLVFACIPVGAWGVVRLLRPFSSQRASLVAGLAYVAMALPYNALALGRWGALVIYAGAPWVLARLFAATGAAPYGVPDTRAATSMAVDAPAVGEYTPAVGERAPQPGSAGGLSGWVARAAHHRMLGSMLALGLVEAVLVSFVPSAAVVVVLAAAALALSSFVNGDWRSTGHALGLALGSTALACVICLPWLIGVLSAGRGASAVFGVPTPASEAASWGSLLRFAAGPIGASPLAWGFAIAAVVPLVLARGPRFRWSVRLWSIALVFWFAAWVVGRGWTGGLAIDPLVLLGPAAVAVAASIGLAIAAFEEDLRAAEFGWRQLVTVVAVGAVVLGSVPTLISALPGRWDLPVNDFSQSVTWMDAKTAAGAFRVLWLGDPRSLNQGGWSAGDGLAYATSENGGPDARWLWNATSPGPAAGLATSVNLARSDRTDQLGSMLAGAGVRYVVLLTAVAPEISGEQSPQQYPVPSNLPPALARQLDLIPIIAGTGITVYENAAWIPERAEVAGASAVASPSGTTTTAPVTTTTPTPGAPIAAGAQPVLPGPAASRSYQGPLSKGTVLAALAPAGRWTLVGPSGTDAPRSPWVGWAASYQVATAGAGTLRFDGGLFTPASAIFSTVVWLAVVVALMARRRLRGPWSPVLGARRRRSPGMGPTSPNLPEYHRAHDGEAAP